MAKRSMKPSEVEIEIEAIGAQGDAVGRHAGETVYVTGGAPGDRLRVRLRARRGRTVLADPVELVRPGPGRQTPPCPHFGACGGCRLQHVDETVYAGWKRDQVCQALGHRGLDAIDVAPLVRMPPNARRRARLAARRGGAGVFLGFHEHRSHRIVTVTDCKVLVAPLVALLDPLRALLGDLLRPSEACTLLLTALDDGADLVIEADRSPDLPMRERLAAFAGAHDVARLSWRTGSDAPEPVAARRTGVVLVDGVAVAAPPGPFLQASRPAEDLMTARVRAAIADRRRVADLFCGLGAFALPLAAAARVAAFDSDGAAIAALSAAANRSGRPVTAAMRNLYSQPLDPAELAGFDAVVIDPPRLGARDQALALAASTVPMVVSVSCNPATFARDARLLVDGGYRCAGVTPIDQFVWSPHVELLAVFWR